MTTLFSDEDLVEVFETTVPYPLRVEILQHLEAAQADAPFWATLTKLVVDDGGPFVPDKVIDLVAPLLRDEPVGEPFAFYVHRGLHRLSMRFAPPLDRDRYAQLNALKPALQAWAARSLPTSFLYKGLRLLQPNDEALEHVSTDLSIEAIAFLGRSAQLNAADVPADLLQISVNLALLTVLPLAQDRESDTWVLTPSDPDLQDVCRWLERVAFDPAPILLRLDSVPPARLVFRMPRRRVVVKDDGHYVDGIKLPHSDVRDGARDHFVDGDDLDTRARSYEGLIYDLSEPKHAEEPDAAVRALAQLAVKHPALEPMLARRFAHLADGASVEACREAAAASPALLNAVRARKPGAVEGAVALVEIASRIADPDDRLDALLAIGAPAADALEAEVRRDARVCDEDADAQDRLRKVIDKSAHIGLPFWNKLVNRSAQFTQAKLGCARLRRAWAIDPSPLLYAIKRHTKNPDAAAAALVVLVSIRPDVLVDVPDEVLAICTTSTQIPLFTRVEALAFAASEPTGAGGPEASRMVRFACSKLARVLAVQDASVEFYLLDMAERDPVWRVYSAAWRVDLADLLVLIRQHGGGHRPSLLPASAFDEVLAHALGETPIAAVNPHDMDPVLWAIAASAPADRVPEVVRLFEKHGLAADAVEDARRRRRYYDRTKESELIDGLFDVDLGELHAALGVWFEGELSGGPLAFHPGSVLRRSLIARCTSALGTAWPHIQAGLGTTWPTRSNIEDAARDAGVDLDPKVLDICADEATPRIFRAALRRLIAGNGPEEDRYGSTVDAWAIVTWVLRDAWSTAPELAAKHTAKLLEDGRAFPWAWTRQLVLALVALREPCGNTVPDAITSLFPLAPDDEEKAFLVRQRDTFARGHTAVERRKPPEERTATARYRIAKAAGRS